MHVSAEMRAAWTQLWTTGDLDSLPQQRAAGLLAPLESTWRRFFSSFADGAKLLDLATGGGEVLRAALAVGRKFHLTGVDIADLSAVRASFQTSQIELVGGTDLARLPLPDCGFDGVASQFGIEYADVEAATQEAVRVLANNGRGHLVLHHRQSVITQGVIDNLAAERSIFSGDDAFRLGSEVFELKGGAAATDAIKAAEAEFRRAVAVLHSRLRNEPAFGMARNVVGFLTRLAQTPDSLPPAEALHRLNFVKHDTEARRLRKQAQVDSSLDRDGVNRLSSALTKAGAVVDPARQLKYQAGQLMAWELSFCKGGERAQQRLSSVRG